MINMSGFTRKLWPNLAVMKFIMTQMYELKTLETYETESLDAMNELCDLYEIKLQEFTVENIS